MATDESQLYALRRDVTGGMNNRQIGTDIKDNQVTLLYNADIAIPGESSKRPGLTLTEDIGNDAGIGLFGFMPVESSNLLIAQHGAKLESYGGSGTFNEVKTNFTPGTKCTMLRVIFNGDDGLLVKIDGNNWFQFTQAELAATGGTDLGNGSDDPPDTEVAAYFKQRLWTLKDNGLGYSTVAPTTYAGSFTNNFFQVDVGEERALLPIREEGLIIVGSEAIYSINPSVTPAATDNPQKVLDIGCVAGKTVVQVGDDVLFLAPDGVRGLYRSAQDKLQSGESYPLSYVLKNEYEEINWAQIDKACAVYYDNKYFLSLPTGSSTYNNKVWVYYPATNAWMIITGWNISAFAKVQFNKQELLYAFDSTDGKVYRAWYGTSDNGTAINYQEEGRVENFNKPMITKSGGEFKVKAQASGNYDLDISVDTDGDGYVSLGTMNLFGLSPIIDDVGESLILPVQLYPTNYKQEVFHIDSFGEFNEIKYKIQHNAASSDEIKIYERLLVTFGNEYEPEYTR